MKAFKGSGFESRRSRNLFSSQFIINLCLFSPSSPFPELLNASRSAISLPPLPSASAAPSPTASHAGFGSPQRPGLVSPGLGTADLQESHPGTGRSGPGRRRKRHRWESGLAVCPQRRWRGGRVSGALGELPSRPGRVLPCPEGDCDRPGGARKDQQTHLLPSRRGAG